MKYKKTILVVSVLIIFLIIFFGIFVYRMTIQGKEPFRINQGLQESNKIDLELSRLSDWSLRLEQRIPSVLNIDDNYNLFTFKHIKGAGEVGWTRIMKNGEIKDSLGFYTNNIDPVLVPLTKNTLIGSAWQWPVDNKLYNGPFFNYYLDFSTRKNVELETKGRLIAKSSDGRGVVFLESECIKNSASLEIDHACNNQNLSLRLIDLTANLDGAVIDHYNEIKLLDFDKVIFSPKGDKLAIAAKIEAMDYDSKREYWTIFVADFVKGEIIKQNNSLVDNRYANVYWLDNENIIYW